LAERHTQDLPVTGAQMLGYKHNLTAMIRIMSHLPIDSLHHRVRFAANGDGAAEVGV
jgi:hypothetical protein